MVICQYGGRYGHAYSSTGTGPPASRKDLHSVHHTCHQPLPPLPAATSSARAVGAAAAATAPAVRASSCNLTWQILRCRLVPTRRHSASPTTRSRCSPACARSVVLRSQAATSGRQTVTFRTSGGWTAVSGRRLKHCPARLCSSPWTSTTAMSGTASSAASSRTAPLTPMASLPTASLRASTTRTAISRSTLRRILRDAQQRSRGLAGRK